MKLHGVQAVSTAVVGVQYRGAFVGQLPGPDGVGLPQPSPEGGQSLAGLGGQRQFLKQGVDLVEAVACQGGYLVYDFMSCVHKKIFRLRVRRPLPGLWPF